MADNYFLFEPKCTRGLDLSLDLSFAGTRDSGSKKGFTLIIDRKYYKWRHGC